MKIRLTLLINLIAFQFSLAQESGNWWMYFGDAKVSDRIHLHHEIQYRNYNFIGDLEQLLIRGGVGYDLSPNNHNLLLGYGFIQSEIEGENNGVAPVIEHRIFQQYLAKHKAGRINFTHRLRMEERFVEGNTKYRFRYFISGKIPFSKRQLEARTWYASLYSELFLEPGINPFERNRLYGALGYAFNNRLKIEAGYMSQIYLNSHSPQFQIALFNTLDLRR